MEMPNYLDYGKMMEMNPMAYQQSQDQLSLAKQFQAEKQKQAEAKSLADMMANDQTRSMNPMLLEGQSQINQGRSVTNQSSALDFERKKATHVQDLNADQRAAARKLTEDDFKEADQHIEKMLRSGDQAQIQDALKAQQYLPALLAEKRKHEREMELERYKQQQETGRSVERNNTTLQAAQMGNNSREAIAANRTPTPPTFWSNFNSKLKTARDKHAALVAEATRVGPEDPDYAKMLAMADAIRPQAEAEISSAKPGAVDVSKIGTGIPVQAGPQISPNQSTPRKPAGTKDDPIVLK